MIWNYEVKEHSDGKLGIYIKGLCVGVVNSKEELEAWMNRRRPERYVGRKSQGEYLARNIYKV